MANLFDTGNVPTTEPATIVAGDLLQWKRTDLGTDYANGSYTLKEAQIIIEDWRKHYNTKRPHSALGYRPPAPETIVPMATRPVMH